MARHRCLPCVPARLENDVDMSVEAIRGLLVRALVEHSGETSCMPSRRMATKPVRFAQFGVGTVTAQNEDEP